MLSLKGSGFVGSEVYDAAGRWCEAVSSGLSTCLVAFEAKPVIRLSWAVIGSPEFQRSRLTLVAGFSQNIDIILVLLTHI